MEKNSKKFFTWLCSELQITNRGDFFSLKIVEVIVYLKSNTPGYQ